MLQVGDTIKCEDAEDMIRTMTELEKEKITTDFMYEKDGVKGLWLVVESIKNAKHNDCIDNLFGYNPYQK